MSNYTKMIAEVLGISQSEVKNICLAVSLADGTYQFSFIQYEDEDTLSIIYLVPNEENSEKIAIINKKYIIDIVPMDMIDIEDFVEYNKEEETTMFG